MNLISLIKYRQSTFEDSLENAADLPAWVVGLLWIVIGGLVGLSWLIAVGLVAWWVTA